MPLVLPASSCLATPEILLTPLTAEEGFASLVFRTLKVVALYTGGHGKRPPIIVSPPALPFSVSDVLRL